jgi:hypothetical protein
VRTLLAFAPCLTVIPPMAVETSGCLADVGFRSIRFVMNVDEDRRLAVVCQHDRRRWNELAVLPAVYPPCTDCSCFFPDFLDRHKPNHSGNDHLEDGLLGFDLVLRWYRLNCRLRLDFNLNFLRLVVLR